MVYLMKLTSFAVCELLSEEFWSFYWMTLIQIPAILPFHWRLSQRFLALLTESPSHVAPLSTRATAFSILLTRSRY